jgi:hypothetical protein
MDMQMDMQTYAQYRWFERLSGKDGKLVIVHLTSEVGQKLNGKTCLIVGGDSYDVPVLKRRANVRTEDGVSLRVLPWKLLDPWDYKVALERNKRPVARVDRQVLLNAVKETISHAKNEGLGGVERSDRAARIKWVNCFEDVSWIFY